MSWIRLVRRTIESERKAISFFLVNTAVLVLIFNLMMDTVSIAYPVCMSLVILAIYLAAKAVVFHRFEESLSEAKEQAGLEPDAESVKERLAFDTIDAVHAAYRDKLAEMHDKLEGRNSLFSRFVHNMKTSLAVIELASSKREEDAMADIVAENEKLKANMEQALNVLRLDEFSNDYVPERVDLLELAQAVINDKRRDFIYAGVYPKLSSDSEYVYTDRKWCAYLLDQLVANAIKYSRTGGNVFFDIERDDASRRTRIRIRDEGEGIDPEDLPRVFELFFTGKNGRNNKNATGIGLAMAKHIAKRLGHEIELASVPGAGTTATVSFPFNNESFA